MVKIKPITIRLSDEVYAWIDINCEGNNISEKVRDFLSSVFFQKKYLESRKEQLKSQIREIDAKLKDNLFSEFYKFPKEEKEFLLDAFDKIEENPNFLVGQSNLYNTNFHKNLSLKEFRLLLYEVKNGKR